MMWIWFAVAILLLVMELATIQLISLWFSVSAFIMGLIEATFGKIPITWQMVLFVVLSVVLLLTLRPILKKFILQEKSDEKES